MFCEKKSGETEKEKRRKASVQEGTVKMKKEIIATMLAGICAVSLAAELKVEENLIRFGKVSQFKVLPTGSIYFHAPEMLVNFTFSFGTKHPKLWFSPGAEACKPEFHAEGKGNWSLNSKIPASETDVIDFSMKTHVTPQNTIRISYLWKTADMKNIKEAGAFLYIPMKAVAEKGILIGGTPITVVNENKYGWFSKVLDTPEITLFKGEAGKEIMVAANQKCVILLQSSKDTTLTIRFYPISGGSLDLTITPQ